MNRVRLVALAQYYKLITQLEVELKRPLKEGTTRLSTIHARVTAAFDAHAEIDSPHAPALYKAMEIGPYALEIDQYRNVAHNARNLHAALNRAVA